jgi:hypothetical protein
MEIVRLDPADPESVDAAFSEIRRRFGEPPRAMRRGLTGSIMRLTTVCGDRVDNRPNPEDFFWRSPSSSSSARPPTASARSPSHRSTKRSRR